MRASCTRRVAWAALLVLAAGGAGPCRRGEEPALAVPAPPASARGWLRVSGFGPGGRTSQRTPLRHVSVFVRGTYYTAMEDNDLRGFLDGRFIYGWNQPGQVHVRLGRRFSDEAQFGEYEIFRVLQRWADVALAPGARVARASLTLHVEKGPPRAVRVLLYEVLRDWNPGHGGVRGDNISKPLPGEVWWNERAHAEEAWGLPGAGYASDRDPQADTAAQSLAEARWEPGDESLELSSPQLAAYVERRARAGAPLLFLLKLADADEDSDALLFLHSANEGVDRNPARRPRLEVEWQSPAEVARLERPVLLEAGRELLLPPFDLGGATRAAATFVVEPGFEAPALEWRAAGAESDAWLPLVLPGPPPAARIDLRLVAARDPVVLGSDFEASLHDTWVKSAPPEAQRVEWHFAAPDGSDSALDASFAGDWTWTVRFTPTELGRHCYVFTHSLEKPYRGAEGCFDVVPGDRDNVRRQLRALLERVAQEKPASEALAIARFGRAFWKLERAALSRETPESWRSPSGRELLALLTEVRRALVYENVPLEQEPDSGNALWKSPHERKQP